MEMVGQGGAAGCSSLRDDDGEVAEQGRHGAFFDDGCTPVATAGW
jgi:hypothetical protein